MNIRNKLIDNIFYNKYMIMQLYYKNSFKTFLLINQIVLNLYLIFSFFLNFFYQTI